MRTVTSLIASQNGMVPSESEPDFAVHNKGVCPRFFVRADPVFDEKGKVILDATGKPQEREIELVTISIVGDPLSELTTLAVDSSPMSPHLRFAEAYKAWKDGTDHANGTSLDDWGEPDMTPRFIDDLNRLNVSTIEDLGAISDAHITRFPDGRLWRSRANAWLEARPKKEEASELQKLREENAAMKVSSERMLERLGALEAGEAVRKKMEAVRSAKVAKQVTDA